MKQSPSWDLVVAQQVKKFSKSYATRGFITVFSQPQFTPILSTSSHHIPLRPKLVLSHLLLCFPGGLFLLFPHQNRILLSLLRSRPTCHMLRPSHLPWSDPPNNISWEMEITKLLMPFFPVPLYFIPLWPKYLPQYPVPERMQPMFFP
jgi:hypothetical protein